MNDKWKSVKEYGWPARTRACTAHIFTEGVVYPATYQDDNFYGPGGYRIPSNSITHYIIYETPEPPAPEILPCPWPECGSSKVAIAFYSNDSFWVECRKCHATSPKASTAVNAILLHNSMHRR